MKKSTLVQSDRFRRLFTEGVWVAIGQIIAIIGSLVGVRLLTGVLGPASYGELALGMTVATLVNQTVLGPITNGAVRFYSLAIELEEFGSYIRALRLLIISATGGIVILGGVCCVVLGGVGRIQLVPLLLVAFLFAIFSGYSAFLNAIQNAARQRSLVAIHQGVEPWARFLIAVVLLLWIGPRSEIALVGYSCASILVAGSQYLFFLKKVKGISFGKKVLDGWQKRIWGFSWPISVFGVFTWMQLASDRWCLELFSSTQDVGFYAVLYQLGYYPMTLLSGMMMQLLVPVFFQRAGDATNTTRNANVDKLNRQVVVALAALTGIAFCIAFFFHGNIFELLVATEYSSVSFLMPWVLLSGGIYSIGQTIAVNLQCKMKTRELMNVKIWTALLGVALNILGASLYGILGVVAAGVLFSLAYLVWASVLLGTQGGQPA